MYFIVQVKIYSYVVDFKPWKHRHLTFSPSKFKFYKGILFNLKSVYMRKNLNKLYI